MQTAAGDVVYAGTAVRWKYPDVLFAGIQDARGATKKFKFYSSTLVFGIEASFDDR